MWNTLGKALILVFTIGCLMGLMLAYVVYFEFIDWGRSVPRVVAGESGKGAPGANDMRVASEYDKSKVIFDNAKGDRDLAVPPLVPAEVALRESQDRFAQNHLFYVAQLRNLESGVGDIEVKRLPPEGIPTDTPGKAIGKPIPTVKMPELKRSMLGYDAMLKDELAKLKPLDDQVRELAKKNSDITYQLTGKNDKGEKVTHGLYELVDLEYKTQQRLLAEYNYVQPQWASIVEDARRYGTRRTSLEGTLSGLEKALKGNRGKER
jgi:hypothetical protein